MLASFPLSVFKITWQLKYLFMIKKKTVKTGIIGYLLKNEKTFIP
jgi:hypothetical protein